MRTVRKMYSSQRATVWHVFKELNSPIFRLKLKSSYGTDKQTGQSEEGLARNELQGWFSREYNVLEVNTKTATLCGNETGWLSFMETTGIQTSSIEK